MNLILSWGSVFQILLVDFRLFQTSQFKQMNWASPYFYKSHYVQEFLWFLWNETTAEEKGSTWMVTANWLITLIDIKDRKQPQNSYHLMAVVVM